MKALSLKSKWLYAMVLIILIMGVLFRFVNIDRKLYWYDETFTSLRISGYTTAEFIQQVSGDRTIGLEDLMKYQRPNSEKNLIDTIKSLAAEEPQHPPLYFAIARFWEQCFGHSVTVIRRLSALISLLILPSVYWLCYELFKSSKVAWFAVVQMAVSPFHILYAQESREYSLWMLISVLSSIAFLRAIRLKTGLSWVIYAVTLVLGLYTYPFFALTAIGYGIYAIALERFQFSKTFTGYLLASLAGFLAFIPWIVVFINRLPQTAKDANTAWMFESLSLPSLAVRWIGNVSRIFVDWGYSSDDELTFALLVIPPILLLVGYSIYFLCVRESERVWLFILTAIATPAIVLVSHDLILGGRLSVLLRYLTPCVIGIQLAVAYLLSTQLTTFSTNIWRQKLWQLTWVFAISCGIVSCIIISQATDWWHQGPASQANYRIAHTIARILNQSAQPLLVCDLKGDLALGAILPISYLAEPKVRFKFALEANLSVIPDGFSDVFLFSVSQDLKNSWEKINYSLEPVRLEFVDKKFGFWTVRKHN